MMLCTEFLVVILGLEVLDAVKLLHRTNLRIRDLERITQGSMASLESSNLASEKTP